MSNYPSQAAEGINAWGSRVGTAFGDSWHSRDRARFEGQSFSSEDLRMLSEMTEEDWTAAGEELSGEVGAGIERRRDELQTSQDIKKEAQIKLDEDYTKLKSLIKDNDVATLEKDYGYTSLGEAKKGLRTLGSKRGRAEDVIEEQQDELDKLNERVESGDFVTGKNRSVAESYATQPQQLDEFYNFVQNRGIFRDVG
tara:strand:- start:187 stop:777 length:591 start_codon:yes stop_codon:yes gene_type:complete